MRFPASAMEPRITLWPARPAPTTLDRWWCTPSTGRRRPPWGVGGGVRVVLDRGATLRSVAHWATPLAGSYPLCWLSGMCCVSRFTLEPFEGTNGRSSHAGSSGEVGLFSFGLCVVESDSSGPLSADCPIIYHICICILHNDALFESFFFFFAEFPKNTLSRSQKPSNAVPWLI